MNKKLYISLSVALLIIAISIGYYFVLFLPTQERKQNSVLEKKEQMKIDCVARVEMEKKDEYKRIDTFFTENDGKYPSKALIDIYNSDTAKAEAKYNQGIQHCSSLY